MFHRGSSKTNCAATLFNQRDSAVNTVAVPSRRVSRTLAKSHARWPLGSVQPCAIPAAFRGGSDLGARPWLSVDSGAGERNRSVRGVGHCDRLQRKRRVRCCRGSGPRQFSAIFWRSRSPLSTYLPGRTQHEHAAITTTIGRLLATAGHRGAESGPGSFPAGAVAYPATDSRRPWAPRPRIRRVPEVAACAAHNRVHVHGW